MPETEGKTVKISHEKYAKSGVYRLFYCPGCEDFHAFFTHGIPPLHAITTPDPSPVPAQPSDPSPVPAQPSDPSPAPAQPSDPSPVPAQPPSPAPHSLSAPALTPPLNPAPAQPLSPPRGTADSAPPPVGPTVTPAIIQAIPGHYCALTIEDGMLVYGQECSHHLAGHVVPMVDLDQETP